MKIKDLIEGLHLFSPDTEIALKTVDGLVYDFCIEVGTNTLAFAEWEKEDN